MPILLGNVKLVNANFSWQLQSGRDCKLKCVK